MQPITQPTSERPPATAAETATARRGPQKNPWLAGMLSMFPGMGNVYNGLYTRAVTFFLAITACMYLATQDRGEPLFGFATAFIWFFNVLDAFRQATLINYGYVEDLGVASPARGQSARNEKLFAGVMLLALGTVAVLKVYLEIELDWVFRLWPLALLGAGGWLLWSALAGRGQGAPEDQA